jgi:hypothetical protein
MAKMTQWEKREILKMFKCDRAKERHVLVEKYKLESMELTREINVKIDALQAKVNKLMETKRVMLEKDNYTNLTPGRYSCNVTKEHPVLKQFDEETNCGIRAIIGDK